MSDTSLREVMAYNPDGIRPDFIIKVNAESEWGDYDMEEWGDHDLPYLGTIGDAPKGLLDQPYDSQPYGSGFGAPRRPYWELWTTDYCVSATEYDGSTYLTWVRRNPPTTLNTTKETA